MTQLFIEFIPLLTLEMTMTQVQHRRLIANARRARTIANREQERGKTDLSIAQTRRMALSVAAAQRWVGAARRENVHVYPHAIGVLCANCPK